MIIYKADDLGSYYRLNGDILEYAPMNTNDSFDMDDFSPVEPSDEVVTFLGRERTLTEVDEIIVAALKSYREV